MLLPALLGWPWLYRLDRPFALLLAALIVETVAFYASYLYWSGDWTWGPRYLVTVVPLLILPLLPLLERWRELPLQARGAFSALAAFSAAEP